MIMVDLNGDLLITSRMNPNQAIEQLPFEFTKLWVRCYDLPPKCYTKDFAAAIGNSLGKFCETDLPPEDPDEAMLLVRKLPTVRKYLRVKFEFNLYGPLKSTQEIKICNSNKMVLEAHISRLTYERLPHTCFRCGYIGHLVESCSFVGPLIYGEWIRAEKFFRINLQSNPLPRVFSSNKEGQSSTSQQVVTKVTKVSNVAELVNTMINDPNVIRADFSRARAEGTLPISKGKAPMLSPPKDCSSSNPQDTSLVPFNELSPSKSVSPRTVFGPPAVSIMGPPPSLMRLHGSPIASDPILIDSDEGQFAAYLNSIASHEDPFVTNASRSLFNSDIPITSPISKGLSSSPNDSELIVNHDVTKDKDPPARLLSSVFKEELRKLPAGRKRAPINPLTPRPKRGKQSSTDAGPV